MEDFSRNRAKCIFFIRRYGIVKVIVVLLVVFLVVVVVATFKNINNFLNKAFIIKFAARKQETSFKNYTPFN